MSEPIKKSENRFHSVKNQYVATFAANIISLSFGCMLGWTSPALAVFLHQHFPNISFQIFISFSCLSDFDIGRYSIKNWTIIERRCILDWVINPDLIEVIFFFISWISFLFDSSISSIGGIFGTFVFGYLVELFGSKRVLLAMSLPSTLFWIIIYFGDTYYHILIARYFFGFLNCYLLKIMIFLPLKKTEFYVDWQLEESLSALFYTHLRSPTRSKIFDKFSRKYSTYQPLFDAFV